MGISLTSVFVDDTSKALKFYTEVLGLDGHLGRGDLLPHPSQRRS
jgi:catechol 2,3-dioxygenase-like lactoylglutathione lyase family enzyme